MLAIIFLSANTNIFARTQSGIPLSARSAVVMDTQSGDILFAKNAGLRLPPASTAKVMTVLIALEKLPANSQIRVGRNAVNISPSKAGLVAGARYWTKDLITAALVASSNDAAVALAEAVAGDETSFVESMNQKAVKLGMKNTHFVNATGLPLKKHFKRLQQYTTAHDLARLMRYASRDRRIDERMAIPNVTIYGSDGSVIPLRSHNKMLWKAPGLVKGKTGWTYAAKHTFVGTNYSNPKMFTFAILSSKDPWPDIKRLAAFGAEASAKQRFRFFNF